MDRSTDFTDYTDWETSQKSVKSVKSVDISLVCGFLVGDGIVARRSFYPRRPSARRRAQMLVNWIRDVMKKKHLGSNFEDFLEAEGILEDCRASAIKFKLAHELEKAMSRQNISKAEMAKRLKTSRTGIDRLLDPDNTSITLNTRAKVARLLGNLMSCETNHRLQQFHGNVIAARSAGWTFENESHFLSRGCLGRID